MDREADTNPPPPPNLHTSNSIRDRRATLRMGGGGGALVRQYWRGGIRYFFILTLYNFKNIGGGGTCPPAHPAPRSLQYEL